MHNVDAAGLGIGDAHPPRIMGVLNVSRESPYDPSVFADPGEAAAYVEDMIDAGADIVDVGLESANKRLDVLSAEEERERLDTAIETIESVDGDAVFSIETRYSAVADDALSRGFDMVNDVCGFADPEMPVVCEKHDAAVVKMASPPNLDRPGAIEETDWTERCDANWAAEADYVDQVYEALKQGGFTEKTIIDPAFGGWSEAQTREDDRETFRRLREFRGLARPMLVSINRKNFLRELTGRSTEEALPVSLAATAMAVERGAHVIRTHDVAETLDAAIVGEEFARKRVRDPERGIEELDVTRVAEAERHFDRVDAAASNPDEAVTRVFELTGLDDRRADEIAALASDRGVQFLNGTRSHLLVGTPAALRGLATAARDGKLADRLVDRLEYVAREAE
ncbi:dihydropteroate synthase [Halorhabdus rudnickae]|uniref:dihydropteroate synthase n=1 Tax=Halorhabdus rudnickae TaxID=1775544 RepID=UPI001084269B|nr:dihydropteroate synthase [Halorhabdus rudnickae]